MVALSRLFQNTRSFKVLVLGDFFLDMYMTGKVRRISPEAPVPVLEVLKEEMRPGGAGNVALSLRALGAQVFISGRVGLDTAGSLLKQELASSGVDMTLLVEEGGTTPVKNRLIAESQQLLRIDKEEILSLSKEKEAKLLIEIEKILPEMDVVSISDYAKGFLSLNILSEVFRICREKNIPTIVDPKGIDFTKYRGASLVKPNAMEAYAASKKEKTSSIDEVAKELLSILDVESLLITRSELGMSLFLKNGTSQNFPVVSKEVLDVTGAGDTVLATLSLGLALKWPLESAVELANIAAGIAIERLGCFQVSLKELAARLLSLSHQTKIFDQDAAPVLLEVLKGTFHELLVILKDEKPSFKDLKQFVDQSEEKLVVFAGDRDSEDDLIHFLSSLEKVDYIILQTESIKHLSSVVKPNVVYFWKGGKATTDPSQGLQRLRLLLDNNPHCKKQSIGRE